MKTRKELMELVKFELPPGVFVDDEVEAYKIVDMIAKEIQGNQQFWEQWGYAQEKSDWKKGVANKCDTCKNCMNVERIFYGLSETGRLHKVCTKIGQDLRLWEVTDCSHHEDL